jgi:hypothetical protein
MIKKLKMIKNSFTFKTNFNNNKNNNQTLSFNNNIILIKFNKWINSKDFNNKNYNPTKIIIFKIKLIII